MAAKRGKEIRPIVRLRPTARKNRRNDPERMSLRRYDPVVRRHVEFKESR